MFIFAVTLISIETVRNCV